MKIFFSYSLSGKAHYEKIFSQIQSYLDTHNYDSLNKDLMTINPSKFYTDLAKGGSDYSSQISNDLIEKSKKADLCIFECSSYTLTTGFLIQKALDLNKPVIALYMEGHLPHFLTGVKDEKFQLVKYAENNLDEVLEDSMEKAKSLADKRFNFFISPSLLTYLNQAAKEQGITKSTFIRNLINDYRRKIKQ